MYDDVDSLASLNGALRVKYPALHNHMQNSGGGGEYISIEKVVEFMNDRNLDEGSTYDMIWDYIVKYEHLHDWWML